MKRIIIIVAAGILSTGFGTANAQEDASSMGQLLRLIEQGRARESQEAKKREANFASQRGEQQTLLNRAKAERKRQENESARLEQLFEENQAQIVAARTALDERLGALKELFGVLQTVSGDTQGRFNNSLTSIHYPNRNDFLVELGTKMPKDSLIVTRKALRDAIEQERFEEAAKLRDALKHLHRPDP